MRKESMKIIDINQTALLALIREALWGTQEMLPDADWMAVEKSAQSQGVLWMAYLGAKAIKRRNPSGVIISDNLFRKWRSALCSGALYNGQINIEQTLLLQWLAEHKIRAAILKGTSCSRYYPFPEARPLGDIDVLVDQENVSAVSTYLEKHGYAKLQETHDFHVSYCGSEAMVEIHYAATDVPDSAGGRAAAEEMTHFLDDTQTAAIGQMQFPVLSDAHQALMLLLHMERHMLGSGIGLRQLCDWAVFVNGTADSIWKEDIVDLLERCGLLVYAKVLTKTCVNYLGLDSAKAAWCMDMDNSLTQAMMEDIFRGGNMGISDPESMGNLFTDRSHMGNGVQSKQAGLLGRLTELAYLHFPCTKKHKALLPVCWIYIPMRYFARSLVGLRPKRKISTVYKAADQRQKLYNALHLYEVK